MVSNLLSEEQQEFQSTLARFFADSFPSESLRKHIEGDKQDLWGGLTDLGLSAYFADESEDAGGLTELGILAFESGKVLWPNHFLDALFVGPYLFSRSLDQKTRESAGVSADFLSSLSDESTRVSLVEPYEGMSSLKFSKGKVSGQVSFVRGADLSKYLVCKVENELLLIDLTADAEIEQMQSLDLARDLFELCFSGAKASVLSGADVEEFSNRVFLLRAAEIAGVCSRAVDMTVEYVKERKQFDVPIGGFQAVQHRISEMYLMSEAIRACTFFGLWAADNSPAQLKLAAQAALIQAARKAPEILESAIQMHGGIGFTWEHDLHLYLRRVKQFELLCGKAKSQADVISESI